MKLIDIRSAIAGAGLVAGIFGLVSMTTAPPYHLFHIQTEGVPTPNQMMRVHQGTPFTVPVGKLFVVTCVASSNTPDLRVTFDGGTVLVGNGILSPGQGWKEVPAGLAAPAGTVVEVNGLAAGGMGGILLGYLADA